MNDQIKGRIAAFTLLAPVLAYLGIMLAITIWMIVDMEHLMKTSSAWFAWLNANYNVRHN